MGHGYSGRLKTRLRRPLAGPGLPGEGASWGPLSEVTVNGGSQRGCVGWDLSKSERRRQNAGRERRGRSEWCLVCSVPALRHDSPIPARAERRNGSRRGLPKTHVGVLVVRIVDDKFGQQLITRRHPQESHRGNAQRPRRTEGNLRGDPLSAVTAARMTMPLGARK